MANRSLRPRPGRAEANCLPTTTPVDHERIRKAVREILLAVGEDPDREGLRETPERVARMYAEMFAGLRKDPCEPLQKTFPDPYDDMVVLTATAFQTVYSPHLLPSL